MASAARAVVVRRCRRSCADLGHFLLPIQLPEQLDFPLPRIGLPLSKPGFSLSKLGLYLSKLGLSVFTFWFLFV